MLQYSLKTVRKTCQLNYVTHLIAKIVDKGDQVFFTGNRAIVKDMTSKVKFIADRDGELFTRRKSTRKLYDIK